MLSMEAIAPKAQHEPHRPWFLTAPTLPSALQSFDAWETGSKVLNGPVWGFVISGDRPKMALNSSLVQSAN